MTHRPSNGAEPAEQVQPPDAGHQAGVSRWMGRLAAALQFLPFLSLFPLSRQIVPVILGHTDIAVLASNFVQQGRPGLRKSNASNKWSLNMWHALLPWLAMMIVFIVRYKVLFLRPPRLPRDDGKEKPWIGEVYKTYFFGRSVRNDWEARFATQEQALKYTKRAARYVDRITPTRYRTEDGWEEHEFGIEWSIYRDPASGPGEAAAPDATTQEATLAQSMV